MKVTLRLLLASAMLTSTAVLGTITPTFAGQPTHNTIVVSCSNGFTRTVSAQAARGVATSLLKFNQYNHSGVTCTAAPGAPRTAPAKSHLTISCSNGFQRRVSSHAANGIAHALTAYNAHNHKGITCTAA